MEPTHSFEGSSEALHSPFSIRPEDLRSLASSRAFKILSSYLASVSPRPFCEYHALNCGHEAKSTFVLHRDILHALLMPIRQLYERSCTLASAALCSGKAEDLELAYRGDARSAFVWLQCFLESDEEDEWCRSAGCAACNVLHALSTESAIRLTMAAIRVAAEHQQKARGGPAFPSFEFLEPALRDALAADPFWGRSTFDNIAPKAPVLAQGISALMDQCAELEVLVSSPAPSPAPAPPSKKRPPPFAPEDQQSAVILIGTDHKSGAKIRPSRLAKRQQRLQQEEVALIQRALAQCWGAVALNGAGFKGLRTRKLEQVLGASSGRRRSLTTP
ncbi:hypothetical protein BDY21DRAFT_341075 [Lineolata rhizophorae]|uniref:Uncharacterized protein n=1 Tax=Lineolata rhizophorae TaxID=578093 RepID=A0A6A6P4M8_9PEZI|nr:hypothetical protein BDY21DRAFT_341075 [Lineolata rhizophorae]